VTTHALRLSVLDLSPVPSGASPAEALRASVDLAMRAEALGFVRYWLAEHHSAASLACSAPEILAAHIAAVTTRLRVGAGGVMLPNHSALKVAEQFRALHALHPGRIDLGVGRAAGTDPRTAFALRESRELLGEERFEAQLDELLRLLTTDPDPNVAFNGIKAAPTGVPAPDVFLLVSSAASAARAGERGLAMAYAHHFAPEGARAAAVAYRAAFRPSVHRAEPYALLAVSAICGEDDAHGAALASSGELAFLRFGQGLRDLPLPSVADALAYPYDADELVLRAQARGRGFVGGPDRVAEGLLSLAREAGADELVVTTMVHDHEERCASYRRLSAAVARA
jgi:luciferase family oxidoreductase group 1